MTNNHKLCCGHEFHTDCIMKWFRSKKSTCPYCRSTGEKEDSNTNSNSIQPIDIISDSWELNEHVQAYLQSSEPTKEQIIEAYYIRDINMDISIECVFEKCISMLSIDPSKFEKEIERNYKIEYENKIKECLKESILNPTNEVKMHVCMNFNKYLLHHLESERFKAKMEKYYMMEKMKIENNHKGIYQLLNYEDLYSMGW
jgi:hypothetical protein